MLKSEYSKVSIVIPTHNAAGTIKRCVDSILAQTYQCFEVIIIDNGSTDNLVDIVNSYSDARIKYFTTNKLGVSNARNMGIKKSKGEFVSFCDADDEYDPSFLAEMVNCSITNNVGVVKCAIKKIYNNHEAVVEGLHDLPKRIMDPGKTRDREILRNVFFRANRDQARCLVSSLLIRRDVLVDNNILFDNNVCMMEDVLFYADLFNLNGKIAFIGDPLFYYHQNPDSATHAKNNYKKIIDGAIVSCSKLHEKLGEDPGVDMKYIMVIFHYMYCEYFANGKIYLPDSLIDIAQKANTENSSRLWRAVVKKIENKNIKALILFFYFRKIKNILRNRNGGISGGSV